MATATVSTKGWIVIPIEFRRKFGIEPGDKLQIYDYGGLLTIVPQLADPVADAMGMFKGSNSLTQTLLEERTRDREREERKAARLRTG